MVEFNHDFYFEKFRDIATSIYEKSVYCLRLCAFIDLGPTVDKANIPFMQQFASRFITVLPVDFLDH